MSREIGIGILVALVACFTTGCDKGKEEVKPSGTYIAPVVRHITELADDDVVVAVDGVGLTRRELLDISRFQAAIYSIAINTSMADERVVAFQMGCEQEGVSEFVLQQILAQEAKRRDFKVTAEMEKEQIGVFADLLKISRSDATYESLARAAGVSATTIRRYLEGNQLAQLVQSSLQVDAESVDIAEASNLVARIDLINDECAASNELQRVALKEALSSVEGGRSFKEAAEEFSEIKPNEGEFWGTFSKKELALYEHKGVDFTEWAFSAPVGSVTKEPVQLDDGVAIVKILDRVEGVEVPSIVATVGVGSVDLARITRRAFDPPKRLTPEEARASIAAERTKNAQVEYNQKLFMASHVEYPNGTNLWDKIVNQ